MVPMAVAARTSLLPLQRSLSSRATTGFFLNESNKNNCGRQQQQQRLFSSIRRTSSSFSFGLKQQQSSRFSTQQQEVEGSTEERIKNLLKAHKLLLFMKGTPASPMCGFSRAVLQILEVQGVKQEDMHTINILEDAEMRAGIKLYNNWPTIPQLFIKGEFVGGTDILLSMHKDGSLEELLEKEGIVVYDD